jgi:hypothetical protein
VPGPEPSRPIGVAILAILIGIVGAFLLLGALLSVTKIAAVSLSSGTAYAPGWVGTLILLILAVILLAVAFGLWDLEPWALALAGSVLILLLVSLALNSGLTAHPIESVVLLLLVVYLAAVSGHFR